MRRHVKSVHEIEKSNKCSICDKMFKLKGEVKVHEEFATLPKVRRHKEAVHEKKRPFKCKVCESYFVDKSYLIIHMNRVHEVKSTFYCPICEATFYTKSELNTHISIIHGNEHGGQIVKSFTRNVNSKDTFDQNMKVKTNKMSAK